MARIATHRDVGLDVFSNLDIKPHAPEFGGIAVTVAKLRSTNGGIVYVAKPLRHANLQEWPVNEITRRDYGEGSCR